MRALACAVLAALCLSGCDFFDRPAPPPVERLREGIEAAGAQARQKIDRIEQRLDALARAADERETQLKAELARAQEAARGALEEQVRREIAAARDDVAETLARQARTGAEQIAHLTEKVAAAEAARARVEEQLGAIKREIEGSVRAAAQRIERKDAPARAFVAAEYLDALAAVHRAETGEALDWRGSDVDLFKTLGFRSSFVDRRELAQTLDFPGRYVGTVRDNVWLHARLIAWLNGEVQ